MLNQASITSRTDGTKRNHDTAETVKTVKIAHAPNYV